MASVFNPFVRRCFNLANLHFSGNEDNLIDRLLILVTEVIKVTKTPSFKNVVVRLSGPAALDEFVFCSSYKIAFDP